MSSYRGIKRDANYYLDWKHVLNSVSISSNLIDEPIFLYNKEPHNLINDFEMMNLELLAEKSKLEMRTKRFWKSCQRKMKKFFDQLYERGKIVQVRNLSTKTNTWKIRKKPICQHNSYEFRKKTTHCFETTSGEICKYFTCFWI